MDFRAILARFSISSISIPQGFQECRHRLSAPPDNFSSNGPNEASLSASPLKRSLSLSCSSSLHKNAKLSSLIRQNASSSLQLSFRQDAQYFNIRLNPNKSFYVFKIFVSQYHSEYSCGADSEKACCSLKPSRFRLPVSIVILQAHLFMVKLLSASGGDRKPG